MATTVYLHRALAHRALMLRRPATHAFRFADLGRHRDQAAPVGGGAPQAPRVHRRRGRPALPVLHGWLKVQMLTSRCTGARRATTTSSATPRTSRRTVDRLFYDHALVGLGARHCLVPAVRLAGRSARRLRARQLLPRRLAAINAIGHHFGRRPYDNPAANLQWLALIDRRRGPPQQPPRPAPARGEARAPLVRDRYGLVRHQGLDVGPPRQAPRDDRRPRRLQVRVPPSETAWFNGSLGSPGSGRYHDPVACS